jgi:hypothetical protein
MTTSDEPSGPRHLTITSKKVCRARYRRSHIGGRRVPPKWDWTRCVLGCQHLARQAEGRRAARCGLTGIGICAASRTMRVV